MFQIGILQLTQNLDDAVRGFKEGLAALRLSANFHYCNADGNEDNLPKLAQKLADQKVDLIFACSTPATKAAQALGEEIPVIFTPVFDPVQAQLVDSMENPGKNTTGMSGMVAAIAKVRFIHDLLPTAKKIGVLYHTKDCNTRIELENFRKAAVDSFTLQEIPLHEAEDISLLEEKLPPSLDALFLPIGKIVEDNFSSVLYYADAAAIPIIASHAPNVSMGALGALVANHRSLGKDCASKAKEILEEQKNAGTIPVGITSKPEILLNAFAAENLGLELPFAVKNIAKEIYT